MKNSYRRQKGTRLINYFWTAQLLSLVLFMAARNLPILDFSRRESFAYRKEPSQKFGRTRYEAKLNKQDLAYRPS